MKSSSIRRIPYVVTSPSLFEVNAVSLNSCVVYHSNVEVVELFQRVSDSEYSYCFEDPSKPVAKISKLFSCTCEHITISFIFFFFAEILLSQNSYTVSMWLEQNYSFYPYSAQWFTLYHTIPTFNDPEKEKKMTTLWEKEKMLVTSIFSFSHKVFYWSKKKKKSVFKLHLFCHLQMLSLWTRLKICRLEKGQWIDILDVSFPIFNSIFWKIVLFSITFIWLGLCSDFLKKVTTELLCK